MSAMRAAVAVGIPAAGHRRIRRRILEQARDLADEALARGADEARVGLSVIRG
jgi:hypothetical protein